MDRKKREWGKEDESFIPAVMHSQRDVWQGPGLMCKETDAEVLMLLPRDDIPGTDAVGSRWCHIAGSRN